MSMPHTRLTALVTGGSHGIGAAVAIELARRGFSVAVNFHGDQAAATLVAQQIGDSGGQCLLVQADVGDTAQVGLMFAQLDAAFGRLDVLVCNAGVMRNTLLDASAAADGDHVLAVDVNGVINCCRLAAMRMIARRRGAVVTILPAAVIRPARGQGSNAASMGAVESFSKAMAMELAPRGIRVNVVAPGVIANAMTDTSIGLAPDAVRRRILLRRTGTADEVARVVAFLCSEDASYVTAQVWNVDGGLKAP